jgi:anti-sigma-K factor RskA
MEEMDRDGLHDKLNPLWAEYREACGDPEVSAHFMPQLWQRIEAQRSALSSSWFRVWAKVWLVTAVMLTIVMAMVVTRPVPDTLASQTGYVDALAAADSASDSVNYGLALPSGEFE